MNSIKWSTAVFFSLMTACQAQSSTDLQNIYKKQCSEVSDIYEHLPQLSSLAEECSSALELGVRSMVSSWGILHGLANSPFSQKCYFGVDVENPPDNTLRIAKRLAESNEIRFQFQKANDLTISPIEVDLLFIDTLHTYCQLSCELERFSSSVHKYIVMHDTSDWTEWHDEVIYYGDYSEYPSHIDKTKRGLWPAVEDFLANHPEWRLKARYTNNYGLTVLERVN